MVRCEISSTGRETDWPVSSHVVAHSTPLHSERWLQSSPSQDLTLPTLHSTPHRQQPSSVLRMDRVGLTSYSDYMRCLAAKYNNNQGGGPGGGPGPHSPANTLKADLLPLLAAHGSAFPAAFSLPGLGLFNPFLASQASQASDTKPGQPVLPPPTSSSSSSPPPSERLKRPKEDPLDLTDKKLKREEREEREESERTNRPSTEEKRSPSPRSGPPTPKIPSMTDWSVEEVADFVSKVDDCQEYAKVKSASLRVPPSLPLTLSLC